MSTSGRILTCPVAQAHVKVITLLEKTRMGSPVVRTFLSCSGMSGCLGTTEGSADLCDLPEECPLRISLV